MRVSTASFERIQRFVRDAAFDVILTEPIVEEVLQALTYPKVQRAARSKIEPALWFEDIVVLSLLVAGETKVPPISVDRDDDKYLAAALEGRATVVVSGNPDLLAVGDYEDIRIVSPRAFLSLLDESRSP